MRSEPQALLEVVGSCRVFLGFYKVRDEKDIRERLASLYEDQGRHEESREISRSQASISNSAERVGEIHIISLS